MKLSVIIPVYNVAPYLRKCVESVVNQDLAQEEYEVILVDDGSTDGSGAICDELAQCAPKGLMHGAQCTVIHQKNAGLSAARNTGVMAAKGEYIQFVDSDDYLEPNVLRELVRQMDEEKLDVLRFDYQNVRISAECKVQSAKFDAREMQYEVFEPYKTPRKVDTVTEIVDGETYLNTRMGYACYAVQFMIRRSLIVDIQHSRNGETSNILFTSGIHFEDVEWMPRMVLVAKRMNATTTIVYNYLMREGSITKAIDPNKQRKNVDDKFVVIDTLNQLLVKHPTCQWLRNMRSRIAEGAITTVAKNYYDECQSYLTQLRARHVFPLSLRQQTKTYLRRAVLINVSPKLYCWVMHKL